MKIYETITLYKSTAYVCTVYKHQMSHRDGEELKMLLTKAMKG